MTVATSVHTVWNCVSTAIPLPTLADSGLLQARLFHEGAHQTEIAPQRRIQLRGAIRSPRAQAVGAAGGGTRTRLPLPPTAAQRPAELGSTAAQSLLGTPGAVIVHLVGEQLLQHLQWGVRGTTGSP